MPCVPLTLQTPHGDARHHQGGEGGLQAGHGAAGVTLRREPAGGPPSLLPQREDHDHPVSTVTAGNYENYAPRQETVHRVCLLSGGLQPGIERLWWFNLNGWQLGLWLETNVLHKRATQTHARACAHAVTRNTHTRTHTKPFLKTIDLELFFFHGSLFGEYRFI